MNQSCQWWKYKYKNSNCFIMFSSIKHLFWLPMWRNNFQFSPVSELQLRCWLKWSVVDNTFPTAPQPCIACCIQKRSRYFTVASQIRRLAAPSAHLPKNTRSTVCTQTSSNAGAGCQTLNSSWLHWQITAFNWNLSTDSWSQKKPKQTKKPHKIIA